MIAIIRDRTYDRIFMKYYKLAIDRLGLKAARYLKPRTLC
jgi:hypothetical protein